MKNTNTKTVSKKTFNTIKEALKNGDTKKVIRNAFIDIPTGTFNATFEKAVSQVESKLLTELGKGAFVPTSVRRFKSGTIGVYAKPKDNLKAITISETLPDDKRVVPTKSPKEAPKEAPKETPKETK
jgi:hypothetical protein